MPTSSRSMVANVLPRLVSLVGAARDERHVLADDDLGLLVVGGEDVRRREDVDVVGVVERVQQRDLRRHLRAVRQRDRLVRHAPASTRPGERRRDW